MGACTGTGKDGPDGPDGALQKRSYPPHSPTPHAPMRRQWVSSPRFPVKQKPDPAEPTQNPGSSAMRPEQALEAIIQYPRAPREIPSSPEPPCARRTHPADHHQPPAHRRQPDTPQYPGQQRDRAGASLGGEQPIPSRKARKLILPRASSASEGLIPRSYRECPLPFPAGAAG